MKKSLTIMAVLLALASTTFAAGFLERDGDAVRVQVFAPNGNFGQALTVNSVTLDLTNALMYGVYAPGAGCKIRLMDSTTKNGHYASTSIAATWTVRAVNRATPFLNLSGCTTGEVVVQ